MTFNLLYESGSQPADEGHAGTWEQRRGVVRELVLRELPDVVGFQEVEDRQVAHLCEDLDGYECIAGPVNGVDRGPRWAARIAPPLTAAGLALWWRSRRGGRAKDAPVVPLASAALLALAAVPVAGALVLRRVKGHALKSGGHLPLFFRRDRLRAVEHGTFWVSERPEKPDSLLLGTWMPRIVNWATLEFLAEDDRRQFGERITVFNAHLDWWWLARARGGRIVASQMNRRWDGSLQVLMGDFNAADESATMFSLMQHCTEGGCAPLRDAWSTALRREGPEETYHGGDGEPKWPGRLDHILLRPACTVESLRCLTDHAGEVYPSDHFPVAATVSGRRSLAAADAPGNGEGVGVVRVVPL